MSDTVQAQPGEPSPKGVYQGLRAQALALTKESSGIDAPVLGTIVEMRIGGAVVTVVGLADGTASLYASTGFGIIGGGMHPGPSAAAKALTQTAAAHRDQLKSSADDPSAPADGVIAIHLLTDGGRLEGRASERDLSEGKHPLSPVFFATHDLIAELRMLQEKAP